MAFQRPIELKEILIRDRRPHCLPQFVLRDRINVGIPNERGVVTVNDFAEEESIGGRGPDSVAHVCPELSWNGICCIKSPPIDATGTPILHYLLNEILDARVRVVEAHEVLVPFKEPGVGATVGLPINVE